MNWIDMFHELLFQRLLINVQLRQEIAEADGSEWNAEQEWAAKKFIDGDWTCLHEI